MLKLPTPSQNLPSSKLNVDDTAASLLKLTNLLTQKNIKIVRVTTEKERQDVNELRLKVYGNNLPYMISQLDEAGQDSFDEHSFIFAAWFEDRIVASVRLTPYPYESLSFLSHAQLETFLGAKWKSEFLEWSRLMVDNALIVKGLMRQLIIYAGLHTLKYTSYTHYFGYSRPVVRRLFSGFQLSKEKLIFNIPKRGAHEYELLKGSFIQDYEKVLKEI